MILNQIIIITLIGMCAIVILKAIIELTKEIKKIKELTREIKTIGQKICQLKQKLEKENTTMSSKTTKENIWCGTCQIYQYGAGDKYEWWDIKKYIKPSCWLKKTTVKINPYKIKETKTGGKYQW